MNKKFVAAGMAAAMAATMLPSMAFADEKPTVTYLYQSTTLVRA